MPESEVLTQLKERAASAVQMARDAGADDAWASTSTMRSITCDLRDGVLERMQHSNSRRLSVRLYVEGRYFSHSTSDLRDEPLQAFMAEAVTLTRALQPDPHRRLPDPTRYEGRSTVELDLVDPAQATLDNDARLARCQAINERIAGKPGVISATSTMVDGRYASAQASSNGFSGSHETTYVGSYASVTLQGEGDRRPEEGMGVTARHLSDLPDLASIGDQALARARARLGSRKGPTITTNLVVDRMSAGRLLYALLAPAGGRAVQQGRSLWADRKDKPAISSKLTLTDEPLLPRAMGSRRYDGEGLAARPMTVFEGGALRTFFLDTYYANKLGVAPTTGGSSNLVVRPGEGDLESLAADVGTGVYVTSWLGGNSDPTSGEFSLGLQGNLIEGGKLGAPVGEMNVTGNLVDLFSRLAAVGGDPWTYGSLHSPTLVFEGVSFSGT